MKPRLRIHSKVDKLSHKMDDIESVEEPLISEKDLHIIHKSNETRQRTNYATSDVNRNRQDVVCKYMLVIIFLVVLTALTLSLYFLMPRQPIVGLQNTKADFSKVPLQVVQYFKVYNHNFYTVDFKKFEQLILKSDEIDIPIIFNQKIVFQFVGKGELLSGDTFTARSRSSADFSVIYHSNSTNADLAAIVAKCLSEDGINFYNSGSFESSTAFGYYYQVPINEAFNYHCA